ncbi:NRDE family protein [Desulfitobacterium sp.]|uniref:NRDE family protein n=1 Tax=Desulfitobacterium sp. TaxID=49981 RepID=UPI002D170F12|nr:NRDE family protein [Desulfitobacterium sp.]HVJ49301.1 NRDE family protein [Desulfitobacterium sp.]
MCLILLAYDCHPQYKFVIAANRDEFYKRPTLPANFWPDNPDILAGRDLEQGGTWMGITTAGRFAALTNYRDPFQEKPQAPSRGYLVRDYLNSDLSPESYLKDLRAGRVEYNGFNLLTGTTQTLYYYSNQEKAIRRVEKGFHGLSNSLLDVAWPKVRKGVKALEGCLQEQNIEVEQLFEIMTDQERPSDSELPHTGVSLELERKLSSLYIVSPDYGTRSTTILLVNHHNRVQF